MKKLFTVATFFFCFTTSTFAVKVCPQALPTNHPNFCDSFQKAASCQCENYGLGSIACSYMTVIYNAMIARYHSLPAACSPANQHETTQQICVEDWTCYMTGKNTLGAWCNARMRAC